MAKNLDFCALLDVYGPFLSEKQRILSEHYYFDDLSLSEIAENEGITRQAVRDIIHRTELQLSKFESDCGYYAKFSKIKKLAENSEIKELKEIAEQL